MKLHKLASILMIIAGFAFAKASAQEAQPATAGILSKQEALGLMLENNFGIQLARNQEEIAENNQELLNSGYLPTVTGNAGADYSNVDSETDFNGALDQQGNPREDVVINDAITQRYNASINVNYLLFDGLGRFYNFKQLQETYNLTQLQVRQTIETTALQLFSVYFEVARLTENVSVFEQALGISRDRALRAQYQFDYGQANKLDVLNAKVDINTDSINLMNARQQLENARRDLNVVLNQSLEATYAVDTTVTLIDDLRLTSFVQKAEENNVTLLQAESNVILSEYQVKGAKSLFLPTIGLTGSYGWNLSNNPASAFFPGTTSTNNTFALGANLTWNLFDGGRSVTGLKNARIQEDNRRLEKEQLELQVFRDIANARGNYKNALAIYRLQEENVATNLDNFNRSQERLRLGQITSLEFRQAQINLLNALTTKNLAKYDAKLAELQLLQLTGQLLNIEL
ncbi:TolC family protein [Croceiramulus getboli]